MQNYSIVTVGSDVFFECISEQKLDYNINQLKSFKEVNSLFKNYNVQDGFVFLFFLDDLEKIKSSEIRKIMFPKIFFSSDPKNFQDLKRTICSVPFCSCLLIFLI